MNSTGASLLLLAAVVSAALTCAEAGAQTIAWGPVLTTVGPTDVRVNGSLAVACNLHGNNTVSPTVNGVPFVGYQPSGWNGYVTTGLQGSTTGDPGYDDLLNGARATAGSTGNPSGWGAIRIDNLATLTPGNLYQIQVWYTDQRQGTTLLYDRVMTLSSAFGTATVVNGEITNLATMLLQGTPSGPLEADPDNAPAVFLPDTQFGSHCTGTFVYVSGFETWLLVQGSHPVSTNLLRPHVTGFQIRDLSSATWAAFGSGCAGSAGVPVLAPRAGSLPRSGQTLTMDLTRLPPAGGLAFMVMSFNNTSWNGQPLPLGLGALGAAGCFAHISVDITVAVVNLAGTATHAMALPPGYHGNTFYQQAVVLDPAAGNALGAVTSNAGAGYVGN